jgi:cytochrome c-type biogenesis protein
MFTAQLLNRLRLARRVGRWLQTASGVVMVVVGGAMMTGLLTDVAVWLLQAFPDLGTLG